MATSGMIELAKEINDLIGQSSASHHGVPEKLVGLADQLADMVLAEAELEAVTDAQAERLADEAERGYDLDKGRDLASRSVRFLAGVILRFGSREEFIDELRKDCEHVERSIVRLTRVSKISSQKAYWHHSVEASAIVAGQLVRFERYMGQLWHFPHVRERALTADNSASLLPDKETLERAQETVDWLTGAIEGLGLEVRAGSLSASISDA